MQLDLFLAAVAVGCGVIVGFTLGLVGGGGSVLAVPLLLYVVGLPQAAALQAVAKPLAVVGRWALAVLAALAVAAARAAVALVVPAAQVAAARVAAAAAAALAVAARVAVVPAAQVAAARVVVAAAALAVAARAAATISRCGTRLPASPARLLR